MSYTFVVQPKSLGNFTIGSASIMQDGNTYKSEPIKISVVKGQNKPKQQQNNDSQISDSEISKTFTSVRMLIKQELSKENKSQLYISYTHA